MLFNSREEREQYVIELYEQGRTIREIAQEVHMSFGNIGDIIKKVRGDNDYSDKAMRESISKDTQAFKLFSKGKKPTEVAINLDL